MGGFSDMMRELRRTSGSARLADEPKNAECVRALPWREGAKLWVPPPPRSQAKPKDKKGWQRMAVASYVEGARAWEFYEFPPADQPLYHGTAAMWWDDGREHETLERVVQYAPISSKVMALPGPCRSCGAKTVAYGRSSYPWVACTADAGHQFLVEHVGTLPASSAVVKLRA